MKNILLLLSVVFLLGFASCHRKEPEVNVQPELTGNTSDTIKTTQDNRKGRDFGAFEKEDTLISIEGKNYKITTWAKLLPETTYTYVSINTQDGLPHKDSFIGFDAEYAFSVTEAGSNLFTTTLHKKDLEKEGDGSLLAEAYIKGPDFLGYIPSFKCFLFGLDIFVPDSDVGDQLLVLMNHDGSVKKLVYNNVFGGGGCDGPDLYAAPDGRYVAFNYSVLHRDGKMTSLFRGPNSIVARRQVNPEVLLVIDEYDDKLQNINARLVSPYGKVLKTFTYKGGYDMLGFVLPGYEDKTALYLLEHDGALRVIPRNAPLETVLIQTDVMKHNDKSTPKPSEKAFSIKSELSDDAYYFLHDTLTNVYRVGKE